MSCHSLFSCIPLVRSVISMHCIPADLLLFSTCVTVKEEAVNRLNGCSGKFHRCREELEISPRYVLWLVFIIVLSDEFILICILSRLAVLSRHASLIISIHIFAPLPLSFLFTFIFNPY